MIEDLATAGDSSTPDTGGSDLQITADKALNPSTRHCDNFDVQIEEFSKVFSPKVSELLSEQALALGTFMGDFSSCDSDDDDYTEQRKRKQKKNDQFDEDEDGMDDEWRRLEGAQNDLRNELALATRLSAFMFDDEYYDDSETNVDGNTSGEANREINTSVGNESERITGAPSSQTQQLDQHSIHHPQLINKGDDTQNNYYGTDPGLSPQQKLHYSLSDHAATLHVTRSDSDRGLYSKPLLSRHDVETLGIVTLPDWITHTTSSALKEYSNEPCPTLTLPSENAKTLNHKPTSNGALENSDNAPPDREAFMEQILSCTTEYIEPPKSKTLRKLFSGWNPTPGERRADDGNARHATGEDINRVTAYSPSPDEGGDSSNDENETDDFDAFVDVDGVPYPVSQTNTRHEPLPIRTVTIRIRPDVLCGAVMGSITDTVERLGGVIVKRQGGHLRAILAGRRMRTWLPGERTSMNAKRDCFVQEDENGDDLRIQPPIHTVDTGGSFENVEDASSIASGITSYLFSSPKPRSKGPTYTNLPPYLVDTQLVTKKLGKTCQRLLLIRVYRIQDCVGARDEEEEEILDIPPSLDANHANNTRINLSGNRIDLEAESEQSLKILTEASALVQRIKAVGGQGFVIEPRHLVLDPVDGSDDATVASHGSTKSYLKSFGDAITSPIRYFSTSSSTTSATGMTLPHQRSAKKIEQDLRRNVSVIELMSKELLRKYRASPSVGTSSRSAFNAAKSKSFGIFPSLNNHDAPYVKASWIFLRECMQDFDQRCLSYSTLGTSTLFQFPALPTLDAHFIFQIKLMCRESMIVSLIKTASELEVFAREFEVSCSNLDQLLRPTFELYKLAPPPLPTPLPLTAYPMDFQAPEDISPPWGPEVAKAIEKISTFTSKCSTEVDRSKESKNTSSFDVADEAILMIVCAFHRQNDTEQGARLGRKNMQVMDRMAKMQAHKRNSIAKIKNSYGR
eukprot:CCRYP_002777-RA/>CCRYP_002777-RA protein AED:0.01 eAED:0.01 QI:160/1/1/1/1/1/3/1231/967